MDKEGKTPLVLASMNPQLFDVAKTLIELGANVNAYRPSRHAGTPLHHAAKRGLEPMVKLLLSHGANALVMNDDCQTALDVARVKGYSNVVRTIENHICLFCGWLQELYGPGFLELLAPQLLSRKVGLSSEPKDYACNGLHKHSKAVSTSSLTLGLVTPVLSVVYSAVRAGSSTTLLSPLSSPRAGGEKPLLPLAKRDEHEEKENNKPVTYSYSFSHIIFSLASMYSAMLLTGWSTSVGESGRLVDVGWPSVWSGS